MPVAGYPVAKLHRDWGDPREGGKRQHQGLDIMAPAGTPVVAAFGGTIEKLFESERGGHTLYIRSPDQRWSLYYAHLQGYAPGLKEGQRVRQGQVVGYVGDSGNAGRATRICISRSTGCGPVTAGIRASRSTPIRCLPERPLRVKAADTGGRVACVAPVSFALSSRLKTHEDQRRGHSSRQHHRV